MTTAVAVSDLIKVIPTFEGNMKKYDEFINTCDTYDRIANAATKPLVLDIVKGKIIGEALAHTRPLDEYADWATLRAHLNKQLKRPVTFEYAQQDLNSIFQKKDETISDYAARVKEKLRKLNEASQTLTDNAEAMTVVRKANEKGAIAKFGHNIRDQSVRILVTAAAKPTLHECILFATQAELMQKSVNIKNCTICGKDNHETSECRKKSDKPDKNNQDSQRKVTFAPSTNGSPSSKKYGNKNQHNRSRYRNNNGNRDGNNVNVDRSAPDSTASSTTQDRNNGNSNNRNNANESNKNNSYQQKNNYQNRNQNSNNSQNTQNSGSSRSVRVTDTVDSTTSEEIVTLEQVLSLTDENLN